jgi:hypothetical protein
MCAQIEEATKTIQGMYRSFKSKKQTAEVYETKIVEMVDKVGDPCSRDSSRRITDVALPCCRKQWWTQTVSGFSQLPFTKRSATFWRWVCPLLLRLPTIFPELVHSHVHRRC